MKLREILKSIANSGNIATSRSVAVLMNISVPKASAYLTRLHKKGWISRQRTKLNRGGYIYTCIITPKGRQYLAYMTKTAQQPKPRADPILMAGLMDENIRLIKESCTILDENIRLMKELSLAKENLVKKDDEISDLVDDKFFWIACSLEMKKKYNEALSVLNEAMNVLRIR